MNNLEKAKELKDKYNLNLEKLKRHLKNKSFNLAKPYLELCSKYYFEIKNLKEKIEKGCGKYLGNAGSDDMSVEVTFYCGKKEYFGEIFKPYYCEDCQEAIKICEEILK